MKITVPTEVGLLGIWDSQSLEFVNDDNYQENFVSDRDIAQLMNKGFGVFWSTGGDGHFTIDVRVDPEVELSEQENDMVEMETQGHKLEVKSDVIFGSPEYVLEDTQVSLQSEVIGKLDINKGIYKVDIYFVYDGEAVMGEKPEEEDLTAFVVVMKKATGDFETNELTQIPALG